VPIFLPAFNKKGRRRDLRGHARFSRPLGALSLNSEKSLSCNSRHFPVPRHCPVLRHFPVLRHCPVLRHFPVLSDTVLYFSALTCPVRNLSCTFRRCPVLSGIERKCGKTPNNKQELLQLRVGQGNAGFEFGFSRQTVRGRKRKGKKGRGKKGKEKKERKRKRNRKKDSPHRRERMNRKGIKEHYGQGTSSKGMRKGGNDCGPHRV
jgi:hypothetical protein